LTGLLRAAVAASVLVAAAVGAPGTGAAAQGVQQAVKAARPNIVVIMTDDQSTGMLDAMPQVRQLLEARGASYPNAVIPTSYCCPSRVSFLTGQYAHTTGVYDIVPPHGGWQRFHESGGEASTLATWLHDAGYRTALVGKYLNGFTAAPLDYTPPGWDVFTTFTARKRISYYDYVLRTTTHQGVATERFGRRPGDYSTTVLRDKALDFVAGVPADQPFFLFLTPFAPHAPMTPAPRDVGSWPQEPPTSPAFNEADVSDKPPWVQALPMVDPGDAMRRVADQHATLRSVDRAVAALVEALGDRAADTLFVYTSDQGLLSGEHRYAGKNVPYAMATEVPLLMRWDGHIRPGSRPSRLALNLDVTATVLDAARVSHPTSGLSLLGPAVRGGTVLEAVRGRRGHRPPYCGWRTARWLYVEYSANRGRELYDYWKDPFELDNLADDPEYAPQVRWARRQAREACTPVPPGFTW
jgi:N-acetylglucosamine-6-sulfatase